MTISEPERHNATPTSIPKVLHFVWLGNSSLSERHRRNIDTWAAHHPKWKLNVWRDNDVVDLVPSELREKCTSFAAMSNIIRAAVLFKNGGVYLDVDVECLRAIDTLILPHTAFAGRQADGLVNNAVMGCVAEHAFYGDMLSQFPVAIADSDDPALSTGPFLMTRLASARLDIHVFEEDVFYPVHWNGELRHSLATAYSNHQWDYSWDPSKRVKNG